MPGAAVLTHIDTMFGLDLHDEAAPPGSPSPGAPHLVTGLLCSPPWGAATGKVNSTVWATGGMVLSQGTDMGFFIPHVPLGPAGLLATVLSAASGSKSSFGAHRHHGRQGPLAAACCGTTGLNLNCGGNAEPPALSGIVLALFQLTRQGFTWGDAIAGALHAAADAYIQHRINRFFVERWGAAAVGFLRTRVLGALGARALSVARRLPPGRTAAGRLARKLAAGTMRWAGDHHVLDKLPEFLASTALGTPIGYSPHPAPTSQIEDALDGAEQALQRSIDQMLGEASIEEHPGPTPREVTRGP